MVKKRGDLSRKKRREMDLGAVFLILLIVLALVFPLSVFLNKSDKTIFEIINPLNLVTNLKGFIEYQFEQSVLLAPNETCEATSGSCYYVNVTGVGTSTNISVPGDLQSSINVAGPGDYIYLLTGNYTSLNPSGGAATGKFIVSVLNKNGAQGSHITLKEYPGEKPLFDPQFNGSGIAILYSSWINVSGIEIINSNYSLAGCNNGEGGGMCIHDSNNVIVSNMHIHDTAGHNGANTANIHLVRAVNVEIYNSSLHDVYASTGIDSHNIQDIVLGYGGNISIHNNRIYHSVQLKGGCIKYKWGGDPEKYFEISNNVLWNCLPKDNLGNPHEFDALKSEQANLIFRGNIMYNSGNLRSASVGVNPNLSNHLIEYNTFYNMESYHLSDFDYGGGGGVKNATFRNNIFYSSTPGVFAIDAGYYLPNSYYYTNVPEFYPDNNCYFNTATNYTTQFGFSSFYNDGVGLGARYTFPQWQAIVDPNDGVTLLNYDANSFVEDPQFISTNPSNTNFLVPQNPNCVNKGAYALSAPPPPDTTPPVITLGPNESGTTNQSITITWTTDENSDSLVKYGINSGQLNLSQLGLTLLTSHGVGLSSLISNKTYFYVVNSTDSSGNSVQSLENNFATLAEGEIQLQTNTTNECDNWQTNHPEWMWCDDFETESNLSVNYGDVGTDGGNLSVVNLDFANGNNSLRQLYNPGDVDVGWLSWTHGDHPATNGVPSQQEYYVRFYHKFESGFQANPSGIKMPPKMMRIRRRDSGWKDIFAVHHWVFPDEVTPDPLLKPRVIVDTFAPNSSLSDVAGWLPKKYSDFYYSPPENIGNWVCHEVHVLMNTPGQFDGKIQFWANDSLIINYTGLDLRGNENYSINEILLGGYWNGAGSPVEQSRYWDSLVISTQRIGCTINTSLASDTIPPIITLGPSSGSVTNKSAIINWTTDENSDSLVKYGTTSGQLNLSQSSLTLLKSHSIGLNNLVRNKTYFYVVNSTDGSGNSAQSGESSFTTLANLVSCTDNDFDGYNTTQVGCGVVDCNDSNFNVNPGAIEVCNGIDDNCVGGIDESCVSVEVNNSYYDGNTTNFTTANFSSFNLTLEKVGYGVVEFLEEVSIINSLNIYGPTNLSFNFIEINSNVLQGLNVSARITLKNISFNDPIILKEGIECLVPDCNILSYNNLTNGTLIFNVSHFTIYSSGERPTCSDGQQNGDETGVDCGGSCSACLSEEGSSGSGSGGGGGSGTPSFPPGTPSNITGTPNETNLPAPSFVCTPGSCYVENKKQCGSDGFWKEERYCDFCSEKDLETCDLAGKSCGNKKCERFLDEDLFSCFSDCKSRSFVPFMVLVIVLALGFVGYLGFRDYQKRKYLRAFEKIRS